MKKTATKILCGVLASALILPVFTGCNPGDDEEYTINMDIDLSQKIDLKVLMPNSGRDIKAVNDDENAKLIQQLTGYNVTYSQLPASDASSNLNTQMIAREEYHAMKLTTAQFADLIALDVLLPLDEALDKFGPELKRVISKESWDVATVDGKIYGIPERASSDNIENPIVFRYDWLNAMNMEVPTTLEEFTATLRAIKTNYNVTPLTYDQYTPLIYSISAAFGIYTEWQEYNVNGETKVLYYMEAPRYNEYVNYMAGLKAEGLIAQDAQTKDSSTAIQEFGSGRAGAIATSLWSVSAIVQTLAENGVISSLEAAGTQENTLAYLRSLQNANGEFKVYRTSGYTYITAIPFYMAENAGYAIDWMNSKITDNDTVHNFRDIVLGTENVHWTLSAKGDYLPVAENFAQKDQASYYLTGSNELVYTQYWKARVRKVAELFRAWDELMTDADTVGVRNIADAMPPIAEYSANRGTIELYAQSQYFIMLAEGGAGKLATYLQKFNTDGGKAATDAINAWYKNR